MLASKSAEPLQGQDFSTCACKYRSKSDKPVQDQVFQLVHASKSDEPLQGKDLCVLASKSDRPLQG